MSKESQVTLYYAEWCPHCHTLLPEWEAFKKKVQEGGNKVSYAEYEADKSPEEIVKGKIEGFPTITIMKKGGERIEYTGKRNADSLLQYSLENCDTSTIEQAGGTMNMYGGLSPRSKQARDEDEAMWKDKYLKYKAKYMKLRLSN